MIGVAGKDRRSAIKLFREKNAHKLVRPRQAAERKPQVAPAQDIGPEPIRATDQEHSLLNGLGGILGEIGRKLSAIERLPARIERHDPVPVLQPCKQSRLFGGDAVPRPGRGRFGELLNDKTAQAELWAGLPRPLKIPLAKLSLRPSLQPAHRQHRNVHATPALRSDVHAWTRRSEYASADHIFSRL